MSERRPAHPSAAPPGITVGDYEILSRLGEGGMGVVHLARRPDGHRVALKVLRPHIVGDDEARERLAREVNSLSRIKSRWVAEIEDADPYGPVPYVATRYVPGLSLHDHVHEEGPVEDLAWFAARLAEGVEAVHAAGVLHRDIKPSNVLMEGRAPILIDFGLARVADDPRLTHTGWLLGTPGYLAPEILYGEDASAASDVHSWAATVAFAGTGRPPFGRGPSMAVMDRVRRGEHDLTGVPDDLVDLVDAALAPEPGDRPSLAEILHEFGIGEAPAAPVDRGVMTLPLAAVANGAAPTAPVELVAELVAEAAAGPAAEPATVPPTGWHGDRFARSTRVLPEEPLDPPTQQAPQAPQERPPARYLFDDLAEPEPGPARPAPVPWTVSFRRSALCLALLGVVAAAIGLAPYPAVFLLVLVAWLFRAGSLAGSGHLERRSRRGPKWYDAFALPLSYPWFFVIAVPGLVMLAFWGFGLATAAGLVAFALAAPVAVILVVSGAVLGASMWWGPGGSRFRGPTRRIVDPLSANPWVWTLATGLVVIAGVTLVLALRNGGVDWVPDDTSPLAKGSFLRRFLHF